MILDSPIHYNEGEFTQEDEMTKRRLKVANLDEAEIKRIKQMEESMGALIVALEPHYPLAELSEEQVGKLQEIEDELGVVLIAYQG
jgi:hypothetical protein